LVKQQLEFSHYSRPAVETRGPVTPSTDGDIHLLRPRPPQPIMAAPPGMVL